MTFPLENFSHKVLQASMLIPFRLESEDCFFEEYDCVLEQMQAIEWKLA